MQRPRGEQSSPGCSGTAVSPLGRHERVGLGRCRGRRIPRSGTSVPGAVLGTGRGQPWETVAVLVLPGLPVFREPQTAVWGARPVASWRGELPEG